MKQLTCEMCGSIELIKQDGFFVCQSCGCKYSVEEAKKLMIEGTVEVKGTVKVDNTALINNYLSIAKNAMESRNNEEAESYANKIIELDPQHSEAWEIKGGAAGWQSKVNDNRMGEAVSAWINSIDFAKEIDKDDVRGRVASAYCNLFVALLSLHAENFAEIQDEDHLKSIMRVLDGGIIMMNDLTVKGRVYFNRAPVYDEIARKLNSCAVDGYIDAKEDFGPQHSNMSEWQWKRFTEACDQCLKILDKAVEYVRDPELGKVICENMVGIGEAARDSCSWRFNAGSWNSDNYDKECSFTVSAKEVRTRNINVSKIWKKFFEKSPVDAVIDVFHEEEVKLGRKAYWMEHQSEKQSLENEKKNLQARIDQLNKEILSLPILSKMNEAKNKINSLNSRKNSLSLFKMKEKKALQEQIDEQETQLRQLETASANQKKTLESQIAQCKKQIQEIEDEFNKERGIVATEDEGTFTIKEAVVDGKIKVTPEQMVAHLSEKLPVEYKFDDLERMNCSLHREMGNCWSVSVQYRDGNGSTGILIIMQAEGKNELINSIIVQTSCGRNVDDIAEWCRIASLVIMSLFGDISRYTLEIVAAKLMLDDKQSRYFQEGLCLEYVTYKLALEEDVYDLKAMLIRSML